MSQACVHVKETPRPSLTSPSGRHCISSSKRAKSPGAGALQLPAAAILLEQMACAGEKTTHLSTAEKPRRKQRKSEAPVMSRSHFSKR